MGSQNQQANCKKYLLKDNFILKYEINTFFLVQFLSTDNTSLYIFFTDANTNMTIKSS